MFEFEKRKIIIILERIGKNVQKFKVILIID